MSSKSSDQLRSEIYAQYQKIWMKRERYTEHLKSLHDSEYYQTNEVFTALHNEIFSSSFQFLSKRIEKECDKYGISNLYLIAQQNQQQRKYQKAVSIYSKTILLFTDWFRKQCKNALPFNTSENEKKIAFAALHRKYADILAKRANCLCKLKKYEKCLRDLNKILKLSVISRDIIEDQIENKYYEMIQHSKEALLMRSRVWLKVGNVANALNDLERLCGGANGPKTHQYTKLKEIALNEYVQLLSSPIGKELPTAEFMRKCENFSLKLNKFSANGWQQLQPNRAALGKRQGHVMIEHNSSLYVFGGTCVEFGGNMFSLYEERLQDKKLFFLRIDIDLKRKSYVFKPLPFPAQLLYCLIGNEPEANIKWERMLTANKWKNNMIILGGMNEPFKNILMYNFIRKQWKCLKVKHMPNKLKKCGYFGHHTTVILNDIMYVFGGHVNAFKSETNMLCSFDLINHKWKVITKHNPLNIEKKINRIPGSRVDHIMWKNCSLGRCGSIYIGFGNHYRQGCRSEIHRLDIWRFDIFERKWYEIEKCGNFPVFRGECGFTESINEGIIVFGGYSSMLNRLSSDETSLCNYSFFGDCFEYLSDYQKWIMIQSKVFPAHRAFAGMCLIENKNILCLYGGYYGGQQSESCTYDDIWIMDLNILRMNYTKVAFKVCGYSQCKITQNDTQLFKCKGVNIGTQNNCVTFYCSKFCQKRDWKKRHRMLCERLHFL
eukprot:149116_1